MIFEEAVDPALEPEEVSVEEAPAGEDDAPVAEEAPAPEPTPEPEAPVELGREAGNPDIV
jgi:hypothetical protein